MTGLALPVDAYRVMLSTKEPRKEVLVSLDEFQALVATAAGDGVITREATAVNDNAPTPIATTDEIVARVVAALDHTAHADRITEMQARIDGMERRLVELSQERVERFDEEMPAIVRRMQVEAGEQPPPAPPAPQETALPQVSPADAIRSAAQARRARASAGGDPIVAAYLAYVAHLARSGQEGPIGLMTLIAEATKAERWQDVASRLVEQADTLARVCVRTYAIEQSTFAALQTADADLAEKIRGGAVAAINAIGG